VPLLNESPLISNDMFPTETIPGLPVGAAHRRLVADLSHPYSKGNIQVQ
ncbi:uncharacterized protein METZ01_LOCUS243674, partial [marine metagenome]